MENTDFHADRARAGDERSLIWLYEQVAPALFAWASLRTRGLAGLPEPEDIVQDVWVRAMQGMSRFEAQRQGSFRAWIFGIAGNVYIELMRRCYREAGHRPLPTAADLPAEVTSITQAIRRRESITQLVDRVAALDPEQRRLFIHRGLEGQKASDVAAQLGLTVDAVHKRWQRLRADLAGDPAWQELVDES